MQISVTTEMLPHQSKAFNKLRPVTVGALFMDMGTGKSRVVIELAQLRQKKIDKVVWFTLVGLKETVRYEISKHTTAKDNDIYLFDSKTTDDNIPEASWYIIGLESIGSSTRVALAANKLVTRKTMIIVDESSYIKGYRAKRTKRVTFLAERTRYRVILTGTPVSQGIQDLYCQMYFLSPKILGYRSWYSFAHNHLQYSDRYKGLILYTHNEEWLAAKIKPYVYQVTKEECLDLPDKLTKDYYCFLSIEQEEYYDKVKNDFFDDLTTYEDPDSDFICAIPIFRLFTRLQSICCGFIKNDRNKLVPIKNERIELMMTVLSQISLDEKIVVWAKYRYSVRQIAKAIGKEYGEDAVCVYYGGLSEKKRHQNITHWRKSGRFLVATQDAGGYGLDLTAASKVIFFANNFKYSTRIQAEDRCYRIGQNKQVTYMDLWADCGIEDRIRSALKLKKDVAEYFQYEVESIKDNQDRKDMIEQLKASL